ncbi:hypothetical protein RND81_11G165800 [Saponaria officinalis]|uniref:Uncharacterized protein n=1 Tax=Saponaria officinalis TaxID=3572 RepID=A0AAW1HMX2_SAPOF
MHLLNLWRNGMQSSITKYAQCHGECHPITVSCLPTTAPSPRIVFRKRGFQHLLQPLQNLDIGDPDDDLQEDAPLSEFTRRVRSRSTPLSPVQEEDTPEDSPQSSRGRRQPNRRSTKKRT